MDYSDFDVETQAGILLDGVADTLLLKKARETLQGRPKVVKGGKSATMKFAYNFTLTRRAVVATMDLSADNLHLLHSDHWLSDPRNVLQLHLREAAYVQPDPAQAAVSRAEQMKAWSVKNVVSFLKSVDLEGPAAAFFDNGVAGADFIHMSAGTMRTDLRLSGFAVGKVVAARESFLQQPRSN